MRRQRLFPFMLDHLQPPSLRFCAFVVLEQQRRAIVRRLSAGTPEWWAAIEAGIIVGGLLDVRTVDLSFVSRIRESEQRAAANLAAALRDFVS